jgi:putative endonuclease
VVFRIAAATFAQKYFSINLDTRVREAHHHLEVSPFPARLPLRTPRPMERTSHVYFMASKSGVLYLGVTSILSNRVGQHKEKILPGFTQKYNATKLVWFEPHTSIRSAIAREKEIKKWRRSKKIALIESLNPEWNDLSLNL